VIKAAGTQCAWPLKHNTAPMAVAQLLLPGSGLQVEVIGTSLTGSKVLGKATLPLDKAVAQPGKFVDLLGDLSLPGSGTGSTGKFRVKARFAPAGEETDFPTAGDEGMNDLKSSQAELNSRVGLLEENIKAQLHKDLAAERESILNALAQQNKMLTASIDNLSKELHKERQSKSPQRNALKQVKLPADVKKWRCAHVQAWLAVRLELPQYTEAFQQASIDGLVLLNHIDRDALQTSLEIVDPLHCQKILEGIRVLREKQKEVDAEAERERLKRLQAKKEEDERKRAAMEALMKESEKKVKQEGKAKKKKKAKPVPKTYFGEVREQNIVDRARIEREMRLYRTEKQKLQDKVDQASRTWKFEYTGAPQPKSDTIWDSDLFGRQMGSAAYRRTMTMDILNSDKFATENRARAPATVKVRTVPTSCSPEEVLALVKGAMYDVSEWLLEVDRIERRRDAVQGSDLRDVNNTAFLTLLEAGTTEDNQEDYAPAEEENYEERDQQAVDEHSLVEPSTELPPPPAYDDDALMDGSEVDDAEGEDDDAFDGVAPPPYDMLSFGDEDGPYYRPSSPGLAPSSPPNNAKLRSLIYSGAGDLPYADELPEPDRMTLVFNALVGQQNNNAAWLGKNQKLTRMKLYGGFESLLRLKVDWTQFDALWTKLDHKRSGDIDVKEFTAFFGDLADFNTMMGTQALSTTAKSKSIAALTKCLFELCDALRHAGFTVVEMFSGFDRNGSGGVSMSEFCSMLRLVVGNHFEKRLIYQALSVLDTNGDKSISLEEVLRFVYRVWKSQLDELAEKLSHLDEHMTGEAERIQKIIEERRQIKEAVKKNFPREWRDRLEREGGHAIPGPFQALLQRMDVGATATLARSPSPQLRSSAAMQASGAVALGSPSRGPQENGSTGPQSPQQAHRSYRPSETWSAAAPAGTGATSLFTASAPLASRPRSASATGRGKMTARQLSTAGQNEIMRFKIKVPAGCAPTRQGATLQMPPVRDLSAGPINSSEITESVLRKNSPFEGYG
jgi:hypothetical protein